MGSKLNKQSCIWEPLNIFKMVFSTPKGMKRKENYLHGKAPNKKEEELNFFWVFILISTTSMEIKLTNFFGFFSRFIKHTRRKLEKEI